MRTFTQRFRYLQHKWRTAFTGSVKVLFTLALLNSFFIQKSGAQSIGGTDFSQSSNENPTLGNVVWIGSILQENNSRFAEGQSTLQRLFLMGIPADPSGKYKLLLSHQSTKGDIHAYDFIVNWPTAISTSNAILANTYTNINPCGNLGPKVSAAQCTAFDSYPAVNAAAVDATDYASVSGDNVASRVAAFDAANGGPASRSIILRSSRTITNAKLEFVGYTDPSGDSYAQYELTWDGPTSGATFDLLVMMAGHLAVTGNGTGISYGPGKGSAAISGGPYHFKLDKLILGTSNEISLGAQDNQIKAADLIQCTVDASASVTNVACNGAATGAIDLTPTGGIGYTYSWSGSNGGVVPGGQATLQDLTGLVAGTYTITVTNTTGGCMVTKEFIVTQASDLVVTEENVDVACNGGMTGSINISVSGGTPGYTYTWTKNGDPIANTTQDLSGLGAGTYEVTVTDANGCSEKKSAVISEASDLVVTEENVDVACNGGMTGSINISVSGGTPGYTYTWTKNGDPIANTTQDLSGLGAGTYEVTVTDANGCSEKKSAVISEASDLVVTEENVDVACNGGITGSINISVSGGTPGYTYTWTKNGDPIANTTQDLSGLGAGTYEVTVTDANGCSEKKSAVISEASDLVVTEENVDVACNGGMTGSINISVSGGTPGYTYTWTKNGDPIANTTQDLSGLGAGTYEVTVTDANGCSEKKSAVISEASDLVVTEENVDVACNGGMTGSINISVSGGTPGYTYTWTKNGDPIANTTQDLSGLGAGTYEVTVTDANGCSEKKSAVISEASDLVVTEENVDVACNGGMTGSINISVSGGTPGYTYTWTKNGDPIANTTQDLSGLGAGTYEVTVTDANGCSEKKSAVISEASDLVVTEENVDVACNGGMTGSINISVSGGTPGYTYTWTKNGDPIANTTQDLSGLGAGTYEVTVTDANGCSEKKSAVISEASDLILALEQRATLCPGQINGQIVATFGGGTSPYEVRIDGGSFSTRTSPYTFTGLAVGSHTVYVRDHNGCEESASISVLDGPTCDKFCTYTQGKYGNTNGLACTPFGSKTTTQLIQMSIGNMPGGVLYIGKGDDKSALNGSFTANASNAANIIAILPGGGAGVALSSDYDLTTVPKTFPPLKNGKIANNLLSQTIVLALNVYMTPGADLGGFELQNGWLTTVKKASTSTCGSGTFNLKPATCTEGSVIKSWKMPSSVINYLNSSSVDAYTTNVAGLLQLAKDALGGVKPSSISYSDLVKAVDNINNAFDECRFFLGWNNCDVTCANYTWSNPCNQLTAPLVTGTITNSGISSAQELTIDQLKVSAYPNPYTDVVKFTIESNISGQAQLEVVNMLGQKIASVYNGHIQANRSQVLEYRISTPAQENLIYIFRIGGKQVTGKLLKLNK